MKTIILTPITMLTTDVKYIYSTETVHSKHILGQKLDSIVFSYLYIVYIIMLSDPIGFR